MILHTIVRNTAKLHELPEEDTNFTVESMVARAQQNSEESSASIVALYLGGALYVEAYDKGQAYYDFPGSDKDFVIETLIKEAVNNEDH